MASAAFKRLWQTFRNPMRYVGKDLEGNKFYEEPNPVGSFGRMKRTVKYHNQTENTIWEYVGGEKRLPAQWAAWLSHTRPNPPSLEELQRDHVRLQRLAFNVSMIEERDRAEREYRLLSGAYENQSPVPEPKAMPTPSLQSASVPSDAITGLPSPNPAAENVPENPKETRQKQDDPWANLPTIGSYRPQPWSPNGAIKRGGR